MPIDDPGWGDFTPPPAGKQPQQQQPQQPQQPQPTPQTQSQPQAPPPAQSPSGPSPFADPKVRMVLGAIVVAALAVGAYFMFFSGDSEKDDDKTPAAAVGADDEGDGGEAPEGDVGTLPLADYVEIANQVCTGYVDDIQAASQAQDFQALAQADQAMLDELMAIPPPDESADVIQGMYSEFQLAIDAIAVGDLQTAQQHASTASVTASQLGLDACVAS